MDLAAHPSRRPGLNARMPWHRAVWAFPAAVTVHNLEEALWLPAWSQTAGAAHAPVGAWEFRFAVAVLTALAFALTWLLVKRGGRWAERVAAYWVAMLLNVVVPHGAATLMTGAYAPGLVTAVALNLPMTAWLLRRGLRDGHLNGRRLWWTSVVLVPALVGAIPVLFWLGRLLGE